MMHDQYIQLRRQVGEIGSGSTTVGWPHPDDFNVAPEHGAVQELYGLHYVATLSQIAKAVDLFNDHETDAADVAECADVLVHGLEEALARARKFQQFSHEYNRCLSAGPGCDRASCPCH